MAFVNTKFKVSDPTFYDTLISEQKGKVRTDPNSAKKWLELGCLQEEKVKMTKCFAEKSFIIRWLVFFTFVLMFLISVVLYFLPSTWFNVISWNIILAAYIFSIISLIFMIIVRYPGSGSRYFRKVLSLDPDCADAYMYLGRIALRRYQKKRACFLFEKALKKGGGKNIERELKTVYEKEFISFFNQQSKKQADLNKLLSTKDKEISWLQDELLAYKNKVENLTYKTKQIKWKTGQAVKQAGSDATTRIQVIRQDYEKQITDLELAMEAEEEKKETAKKKLSNLTMEIMEAKASNEKTSYEQFTKIIEGIMSTPRWQNLSNLTRSCLVTAEHAFSMLDKSSEDTDFSLVGMELCKALETEINKVLVQPFVKNFDGCQKEFLKVNQTGYGKDRPTYFTYLAKAVDNTNYPEVTTLTLGQYLFTLKKTLEGEYALDEYSNFLDKIFSTQSIGNWRIFLQKLKVVTNEYRNSIVHHTHMNIDQYEHLRELIFKEKDALLIQCSKISWHG